MGTTLNTNILFILSGLNYGYFKFEQNPEVYDIKAPKQYYTVLQLLESENIVQRGLLDNEVRVMKWSETDYSNYSGLKRYAERTTSGTIPISYFWDGTVKEFQGAAIEVLDVHGEPIKGKSMKWEVELQFKPLTNFDKEYKVL